MGIVEFGLKKFCLVIKNSDNDACIKELFDIPVKNELSVNGLIFNQMCDYHILNLIVQDELCVLCDEIKNICETIKYIHHSQ
jgi:spore coat polysaccharide biosynthesis predicted glycosyltransferase SpsG